VATPARFEYRHVRVDGDRGPIITGFCAAIPPEGLTVMVGPSGAGKTTLLRLLNRLDDPDEGVVLFEGRNVQDYNPLELRRRIQLVGQMPVTFPGTVADNVGGDTRALLARVGLEPSLAAREADRLSVGEAQRMALARSLALTPDVLALDEPTSALDVANKASIERLIRELADSGLTVVMVSHDPRHAQLADHVIEVHPLKREEP
jgi:putative ABC transport system ATP-binding protein